MTTAVLNVKIDGELKEQLRHYAEANNETLGLATQTLLQLALERATQVGVSEGEIDSQHTEELAEEESLPLTSKEIKALRKLLKKKK